MARHTTIRWRAIAADRGAEFLAKGHRERSLYFPLQFGPKLQIMKPAR